MQPIAVVAAVACRDGRYLVCQRAEGDRHGGLWEFPGGKLEPGEDLTAAARRELAEELALRVVTSDEAPLFEARDPGSPYVVAFLAVTVAGDAVCHEHQAHAWLTVDALGELALAPSDRRFVETVLARR